MMKKINKKGITPVIAVVLLMMMTVAAAGAAYFWIVGVQSSIQSDTENFIGEVLESQEFEIIDTVCDYNATDVTNGSVRVVIYNSGKTAYEEADTRIFLLNSTTGTTNQSIQVDPTSVEKQKTLEIIGYGLTIPASSEWTVKLSIGGTTKEKSCVADNT